MTPQNNSKRRANTALFHGFAFTGYQHLLMGLVFLCVAFFLASPLYAQQGYGKTEGFADLAEQLLPAVVSIQTSQIQQGSVAPQLQLPPNMEPFRDFFERFGRRAPENRRRGAALGSGFIIAAEGTIITNNHVIQGADEIMVVLNDGREFKAELVGGDPEIDLAVLKVSTDVSLPFVKFGDSDVARVGDWVLAIGNPAGLGGTVTAGIISARGRDIRAGPYDDFIQTDAPINQGNSGGPLFNTAGEVIGINTAIYSPNGGSIGIGFSIPSNQAEKVIAQLEKFGSTRRGWLGVSVQDITDELAQQMGMETGSGALIAQAHPDSPAQKAGIKAGDIIIEFDGQPVENSSSLIRLVGNATAGNESQVKIWRDGKEKTVIVTLAQREKVNMAAINGPNAVPPSQKQNQIMDSLGLRIGPLNQENRNRFGIDGQMKGVVILDVTANSPGADKGLRPGHVILEVNQQAVESVSNFAQLVEMAIAQNKSAILMRIKIDNTYRFVVLELPK